ncbi:MAG: inorganic phosphate transporter [Clostridium sp.]|jgi:PiT family inorganic phosphate transporter|nr:inorganic phosphate transporter [Clostridium sp.]
MSLAQFIREMIENPSIAVAALFTLGVILVNGWTDAPNAIATCVSTRSMKPRSAIIMAGILNFLGVLVSSMLNHKVADTISNMVNFGDDASEASIALCAGLVAIVVWATAASKFGIPTSESHALIAGLSGAAIAMHNSFSGISMEEWGKVLIGLVVSSVMGFFSGFGMVRLIEFIFRRSNRVKVQGFFRGAQVGGGAAMAFMHGWQDGQKFMSVFLIGMLYAKGETALPEEYTIPLWLIVLCSVVMAGGTSIGGYSIIKSVGMDMARLQPYQGFAADLAGAACLLFSSLSGVPVSTTHTKTTAIMGVGASKRISAVNWAVVRDMVAAWVLTFPGCGLLAFGMVKLFMLVSQSFFG